MVDTDTASQIKRAMKAFGCKNQRNLADLLKISDTDFSNRKRRGTLMKLLEMEAYKRSVNAHWLLTGEGEMKAVVVQVPAAELRAAGHSPAGAFISYNPTYKEYHDDLEIIMNSANENAKVSIMMSLKGAKMMLGERGAVVRKLDEIAGLLRELVVGGILPSQKKARR